MSAAEEIGPTRTPTCPTSTFGSQCTPNTTSTSSKPALVDHVDRAAGHRLLGRLEDQPHAPVHAEAVARARQDAGGPEDDRGVHVVAARVGDPVDLRAVADVLLVLHGEGVDVGPEGDDRAVAGAEHDVAHEPGAGFEPLRGQPEVAQVLAHPARGCLLLPGQLRVRVQVAAHLGEQRLVGGHGVAHQGDDGGLDRHGRSLGAPGTPTPGDAADERTRPAVRVSRHVAGNRGTRPGSVRRGGEPRPTGTTGCGRDPRRRARIDRQASADGAAHDGPGAA